MARVAHPVIGFLTDFGLDGAAATCRGVMQTICPGVTVNDISHTVRKYSVADGAYLLRVTLPYLRVGPHVAVVDPGVGTERRPIALNVRRGDVLIGPDNGLLVPAAAALGGITAARVLDNRDWWLPATTATFHGRDIFAPVAAHLAAGNAAFEALGAPLAPDTLVRLPALQTRTEPGALQTGVAYVDSFGNLRLAASPQQLSDAFGELEHGTLLGMCLDGGETTEPVRFAPTFGAVAPGETLLYVDSSGDLAIADNQGSTATRLGVETGRRLTMTRA